MSTSTRPTSRKSSTLASGAGALGMPTFPLVFCPGQTNLEWGNRSRDIAIARRQLWNEHFRVQCSPFQLTAGKRAKVPGKRRLSIQHRCQLTVV